jgi:hypothetical protein
VRQVGSRRLRRRPGDPPGAGAVQGLWLVDRVNTSMGAPTTVECKQVHANEFLTRIELPKSMR